MKKKIKVVGVLITVYLILRMIEFLVGYIWFNSYEVRSYETAIDHYVILRIFLFVKAIDASILLCYCLLGISRRSYWMTAIILSTALLPLIYFAGFIKYRCDHVYDYIKSPFTIYEGRLFEYDSMLGKRAIKNARGAQDYWIKSGDNFRKPVIIDSLGFRIPQDRYPIRDSALMLFLGCSFTWGDGCIAEQTYPYLLAKRMQINYINAGQSAYGLAQMYLLAEKLIPIHRPNYLFVQYSPWLVNRSLSPFQPTVFFTDITFPYLENDGDSLIICPPPFKSGLFEFDSERYRLCPSSFADRIRFYYDYGIKVLCHDLIYKYFYLARQAVKKNRTPVQAEKAELFLYQKIFAVAHRYNCRIYIVHLGSVADTIPPDSTIYGNEQVINTNSTLKVLAHNNSKAYGQLFYHWAIAGKDTVIADVHPNPYAHLIIANQIYQAIANKN